MKTPYDPVRGIDLYLDASGEDDWDVQREKYYLFGLMACGPAPNWLKWLNTHKKEYDGMVHWSHGEFGRQKSKLENKKGRCRKLLETRPWGETIIWIFDKEAVKAQTKRDQMKLEATKRIWSIFLMNFVGTVLPALKNKFTEFPPEGFNVRNVVFNNPKKGGLDTGIITRRMEKEFGRVPEFVSAGHPGIDALDGVLWAFHRCFNLGKTDCLPLPVSDFDKELGVFLLGVKSTTPVLLRNLTDIEKFVRE